VFEWGNDRSEIFTGSSDGTLRLWDMRQGTADVFTEEVTNSGIGLMCGKLSPDKTNFLLGDASGSLQILARSPVRATELPEDMDFVYSPENPPSRQFAQIGVTEEGWGGREAAQELLETERIVAYTGNYVGQGPNYEGPFAAWARPHTQENLRDVPLLPEVEAVQRPRSSESATVGLKRKQSNIESERPSKKIKFKISTNLGTELLSTVIDNKRTPSRSVQSSSRKELSSSAAASEPVDIEDFRGSQALDAESEDEDEDDGYIPPHWMVDANLMKSMPEVCQSGMGDNCTSDPGEQSTTMQQDVASS
jgi:hypothetical protein